MARGTVKWFSAEKGFGFISPDNGREDISVRGKNLMTGYNTLKKGKMVEFEIAQGSHGTEAHQVKEI